MRTNFTRSLEDESAEFNPTHRSCGVEYPYPVRVQSGTLYRSAGSVPAARLTFASDRAAENGVHPKVVDVYCWSDEDGVDILNTSLMLLKGLEDRADADGACLNCVLQSTSDLTWEIRGQDKRFIPKSGANAQPKQLDVDCTHLSLSVMRGHLLEDDGCRSAALKVENNGESVIITGFNTSQSNARIVDLTHQCLFCKIKNDHYADCVWDWTTKTVRNFDVSMSLDRLALCSDSIICSDFVRFGSEW